LTNGPSYRLTGKTVTGVVGNDFWIEETDRSAAIRVTCTSAPGVTAGQTATVIGSLTPSGGQRVLSATSVTPGGPTTAIRPLGVIERSVAGKGVNTDTPSISTGTGLYNVGMLVRIAGSAGNPFTNGTANYFYLDDGSGLADGVKAGIKVMCGANAPRSSGNVTVTGLVGVTGDRPVIIIRVPGDVN